MKKPHLMRERAACVTTNCKQDTAYCYNTGNMLMLFNRASPLLGRNTKQLVSFAFIVCFYLTL